MTLKALLEVCANSLSTTATWKMTDTLMPAWEPSAACVVLAMLEMRKLAVRLRRVNSRVLVKNLLVKLKASA